MPVIDTHAHIYPDKIALKAAASIGEFYQIPVRGNGTLGSLLEIGREAGIDRFLVHSVAVSWESVRAINDYIAGCMQQMPETLIGFGAMHPAHPDMEQELDRMAALGLKGVKIHPDIQRFPLDDAAAIRLLEAAADRGLPVLTHMGDPRYDFSHPERLARALDKAPSCRVICAHLGGWSVWEYGWRLLAGRGNVYVDSSSSLYALPEDEAVRIIRRFGTRHVFFGSDYPVWHPGEELARLRALPLTENEQEDIMHRNFERFIGERNE